MAHANPSDEELRQLLTAATVIAIVGVTHSLLRVPKKTTHA